MPIGAHPSLSADALFGLVRGEFDQVPDQRADNATIALPDALMSGFATFSLKDPSLQAFEARQAIDHNLSTIFKIGQFAVTAEWLHFDVTDTDGNMRRFTRQLADRLGAGPRNGPMRGPRMIGGLMTKDVMSSLGPGAPSLVNEWDNHAIYFNPSLMSKEYAAHVGENLLATTPRIVSVQPIVTGLGDIGAALQGQTPGMIPQMKIVTEVAQDATQAFNRMQGAAYVTFSDDASRELAETGLVRAYPDSPRIAMVSSVVSSTRVMSEAVPLQIMDLMYNSVRVIAYPGQAKGAEPTYRLTRGINEAFSEKMVGEQMTGQPGKSAAGVLQAANAQDIPLIFVDAEHLEPLAQAQISTQAKARIVDTALAGYGVLVPEQMVTLKAVIAAPVTCAAGRPRQIRPVALCCWR